MAGSIKCATSFHTWRSKLDEYHDLVSGNEIFLARIKGVGKYDAQTAIDYGLSGANLRCTGVELGSAQSRAIQLIRASLNSTFRWARTVIAMTVILFGWKSRQSLRILEQAVEQFPGCG